MEYSLWNCSAPVPCYSLRKSLTYLDIAKLQIQDLYVGKNFHNLLFPIPATVQPMNFSARLFRCLQLEINPFDDDRSYHVLHQQTRPWNHQTVHPNCTTLGSSYRPTIFHIFARHYQTKDINSISAS